MVGKIPLADQPIRTLDADSIAHVNEMVAADLQGYASEDFGLPGPGFTKDDIDKMARTTALAAIERRINGSEEAAFRRFTPEECERQGGIDAVNRLISKVDIKPAPPGHLMHDDGVREPVGFTTRQPPIIREEFMAIEVKMHSNSDYGRGDKHIGVVMALAKQFVPTQVTERGIHLSKLEMHLPLEYAGQFHAGQKFWLTINPAGKDE